MQSPVGLIYRVAGGFEPGGSIHRHDLDPIPPFFRRPGQPGFEHGFRSTLDYVQQPGQPDFVVGRSEIEDHDDVLITTLGAASHMFVDADGVDAVEPGGSSMRTWRPAVRIASLAVCQDAVSLSAITDTVAWSTRNALSAQESPVREIFARAHAVTEW